MKEANAANNNNNNITLVVIPRKLLMSLAPFVCLPPFLVSPDFGVLLPWVRFLWQSPPRLCGMPLGFSLPGRPGNFISKPAVELDFWKQYIYIAMVSSAERIPL